MRATRAAAAILIALIVTASAAFGGKKLLGEGEGVFQAFDPGNLASTPLAEELTPADRAYLGLEKEGSFTLAETDAELIVIEFLNVHCYACVMQAPIMNVVHEKVESRENLRDKVRFLGIAVGNNEAQIDEFKDNFGITYPVIPDFDFTIMDVIGNPGGTPFLVLFPVGGAPGAGPPARAHMGLMRDPDRFVAEIEAALALEAVSEEAGVIRLTSWRNLEPELSDSDLEARLRASGEEVGLNAEKIEAVSLPGEKFFYRLSDAGGKWLWAKVSGRSRICNICHDIFFIILFDDEGKIVNFSPILVTKYDNVPIDEKDTAFMKKRVIGRYLSEEIDFDPSVDSISTATMSSELIFDTLRRLRKAYETLKKR